MKELHEEIKELNKIKKKEKVLKRETHIEIDEIIYLLFISLQEEKLLILNYYVGYIDYRDVITFLDEIRNSDRITFISDAYINYLNLLPDY